MSPRIGARRRRIEIEQSFPTAHEDSGEEVNVWQSVGEAWAKVEPMRGRELADSGLRMTERPTRFTFPFSTAWEELKPRDRIVLDGCYYDLESVARVGYQAREFEVLGVIRE